MAIDPTKPYDPKQAGVSQADQNNNDRLGQMKARQTPSFGAAFAPQGAQTSFGAAATPQGAQTGFGASFTPGSYAANPMKSTPGFGAPATPQGDQTGFGAPFTPKGDQTSFGASFAPQGAQTSFGAPFGGGFKDLQGSSLGQAPASTQPKALGLLDTAKSMAGGAYHSVVDPIVNKVTEIKDSFGGVEDSIKGLQNTRNQLQTSMENNPQNVSQDTYNSLATADRQIARATGANLPQGVPATGSIENAPVPQGMPAPVAPAAPAAQEMTGIGLYDGRPKKFQMPSAEEIAAFRKQTGTAFNPKSVNDKLSIERMRGGEETFDSKQANAYRAANKGYRPGMYTKG